jgi:hypothetical protein
MLLERLDPEPRHAAPTASEVEAHLAHLLESPAFRGSTRCQDFLRYVVKAALRGEAAQIKERTIACDVFGRGDSYDPNEDSFVRVKASEVRRRLNRFYEEHSATPFRIELPIGTYVPVFAPPPAVEAPVPTRAPSRRAWLGWAAGGVAVGAAAAAALWLRRPDSVGECWRPLLASAPPVVIFLPIPSTFSASGVPYSNHVGVGAAKGAIRFAGLCERAGKAYIIKSGEDFGFDDLKNNSSVLFGAFSSRWTSEMNSDCRFVFKRVTGGVRGIIDRQQPDRHWSPVNYRPDGTADEDVCLAGRIWHQATGQWVVIAAGYTTYGTQAAAELLTEPGSLDELRTRAPGGRLDRGSFLAVLQTKVIARTPSRARILATHFW